LAFTCVDSFKIDAEKHEEPHFQKTIKKSISYSGKALFSGENCHVTLSPLSENSGILFQRIDLPGKPLVAAHVNNVKNTPRCTIIEQNGVKIKAVEHLLSAFRAYDIDNVLVQLNSEELPVGDGSALPFITLIEESGTAIQNTRKKMLKLLKPIYWSKNPVHLVAFPSDHFQISYTLSYPNSNLLKAQFYSNVITTEVFKKEIAPSRTFSTYEEVIPLIENKIIKGGSLENGVIIKDDEILNPEGLRFTDEMVRHKVLDLIGDLTLIGVAFTAHIVSIRSGHASNTALARELVAHLV
jgi:UDP-3-O-[3-hydroxymyristoyl] N-acetylglucosamine deacetylase